MIIARKRVPAARHLTFLSPAVILTAPIRLSHNSNKVGFSKNIRRVVLFLGAALAVSTGAGIALSQEAAQDPAALGAEAQGEMIPRAMPLIPAAPTNDLARAIWQIQLERLHFSCGTIDGTWGSRSQKTVWYFQRTVGLPQTGRLDEATRIWLGEPEWPFAYYIVTEADMALVQPTPKLWRDKSKATYLGYDTPWEMVAEKTHSTPAFLQRINSKIQQIEAGTKLIVPNLGPSVPLPLVGRIEIVLSQTTLLLYDKAGRLIACFPCSIARDKNKRPVGQLVVAIIVPDPDYTFSPDVLVTVAQQEGITHKMMLPPGPNNPVGVAWIGLSLPGYGIHGTPEPTDISRTGSSGCFRLANWNAQMLLASVKEGVPVDILE